MTAARPGEPCVTDKLSELERRSDRVTFASGFENAARVVLLANSAAVPADLTGEQHTMLIDYG